jgi:hypothetical protein
MEWFLAWGRLDSAASASSSIKITQTPHVLKTHAHTHTHLVKTTLSPCWHLLSLHDDRLENITEHYNGIAYYNTHGETTKNNLNILQCL